LDSPAYPHLPEAENGGFAVKKVDHGRSFLMFIHKKWDFSTKLSTICGKSLQSCKSESPALHGGSGCLSPKRAMGGINEKNRLKMKKAAT
jgi:hypothetical protein